MSYSILYVEDEAILGQLVAEALGKAGYDVLRVMDAATGLQQYRRSRPHLCLLDITLPDGDGLGIARQIRAADKQIPIIFLTARVQSPDVVAGFGAGCNDYIRKPFSLEELLLRIGRWMEERYRNNAVVNTRVWVMGTCSFHADRSVFVNASGSHSLTHKESEVLRLLYAHRGVAIGRDAILQGVWGQESIYTSRILDVYISKLRKLFRGTGNEIITLKGIGYRFICG